MTPQPLSDAEFDRLSDSLKRFGSKRAMNLEELDGFLAALVCGPNEVPEGEYLPRIWEDELVKEDAFAAQPLLKECRSLITRHRDFILQTLESGDVFMPLVFENEDGIYPGNDWAIGFLHGMELRRKKWATLLEDEEQGGSLLPIFTLANEHNPDPTMRPYTEPVTAELREKLIIGLSCSLGHMGVGSTPLGHQAAFRDCGGSARPNEQPSDPLSGSACAERRVVCLAVSADAKPWLRPVSGSPAPEAAR
jgi:uncharacterized protein